MTLYGKRKSLDRLTLVFYHQFLVLRKNGCNKVLPFKLLPDKVLITVNFNFTMRAYLPYKGDLPFCNGNIQTTPCIQVRFEIEPYGYLFQRLPQRVSQYSRKPRTMVFLSKSSVRFLY